MTREFDEPRWEQERKQRLQRMTLQLKTANAKQAQALWKEAKELGLMEQLDTMYRTGDTNMTRPVVTQPPAEGWIEWTGADWNPVPGQRVDLMFASDNWCHAGISDAYNWKHGRGVGFDIIAYRPVQSALADAPAGGGEPHPTAKLVAYEDAHTVALELGYPSLTEALEHLAALQAAPEQWVSNGGDGDRADLVLAPADPVAGQREAVRDIIREYVYADDATEFNGVLQGIDEATDAILAALQAAPKPDEMFGVTGAADEVEALACAIWAHRCPGLLMDEDDDLPHYMEAARAAFSALEAAPADPVAGVGEAAHTTWLVNAEDGALLHDAVERIKALEAEVAGFKEKLEEHEAREYDRQQG